MQCWKMSPEDRPTFKQLCSSVSKFIECIAGYLEIGFNPFIETGGEEGREVIEKVKNEGKPCYKTHIVFVCRDDQGPPCNRCLGL